VNLRGASVSKPEGAREAELEARHAEAVKAQAAKAETALKAARVADKAARELLAARALVKSLGAQAGEFDLELALEDEPGWHREDFAALETLLEAGPSRPVAAAKAARETAKREHRKNQVRLVEDYVRQGRDETLAQLDADHRPEAERRRAEIVKRMRAADEDADAGVPRGLRSAFPRTTRV
jgi:hypothetical protein